MIITLTGKPCSGKSSVADLFCKKYKFDYLSTGAMFREIGKEQNLSILELQKNSNVTKIDSMVDNKIINIGKTKIMQDLLIDSRLAWHFIPNSYKVFIDVDWLEAANRLLLAKRDTEQVLNLEDALKKTKERWNTENERYQKLYNINNLDLSNYDLVLDSTNKSVEELATEIYKGYLKYLKEQSK